jgi:hypothetical protein
VANDIFTLVLQDRYTGRTVGASGGVVQVCAAGTAHKIALLDPNNNFVTLANPVTITGGRAIFAIATGGPGQASPIVCDIYGVTGVGHGFSRKGITPGDPSEIDLNTNTRVNVLTIPFAVADCTPGTEKDTGFTLPNGTLVGPAAFVNVSVAAGQASKTLSVGPLSTQGGGSATGYINGVSLTAIANLKTTINGAAATIGVLNSVTQGAAGAPTPEVALVNNTTALATAANISYTITSAATLAEGFFSLIYDLTGVPINSP